MILNLYHRVAENLLKEQKKVVQGQRGTPSLNVITHEIEILGARMSQTVKNYMAEQLAQLTTEIGANTTSIASTQSLLEEGKADMPDNLKTRIISLEEVVN